MILIIFFAFLSLFIGISEASLSDAERFFNATLYAQSIPLYQDILSNKEVDSETREFARFRLSQAYYLSGDYKAAKKVLLAPDPNLKTLNQIQQSTLYQLALISNQLGDYYDSIPLLERYLSIANSSSQFYHEAQLELAIACFLTRKLERARELLLSLKKSDLLTPIHTESILYLSRLYIAEKWFEEARDSLNSLLQTLSIDDPHRQETHFLLGVSLFQEHQYLEATDHFKRALPLQNPEKVPWYTETMEYLAWANAHIDLILYLLGTFQYQKGAYNEAENTFKMLIDQCPRSQLLGDVWFWAGRCAEKLNKDAQSYYRQVFELYPSSSKAAEAFFLYYPYEDYVQGNRDAIRHLQSMVDLFPDSPYLLNAFYLMGVDYKRDRKTAEGKWLRKKNLTAAIGSFQEVEKCFDALFERNLIPKDNLDYFRFVRYRATIEITLANIAIAEDSQEHKKQLYLEYAVSILKHLVDEFKQTKQPSNLLPIEEEGQFLLAYAYAKLGNDKDANKVLSRLLEAYQQSNTTRGYFLSRSWYESGMIALRNKDYKEALRQFDLAEETGKGAILSTDQKIDLLIQQSYAYRGLGQFDDALLKLSQAVNEDAISSLRLKAMFLRAEVYNLQKRPELARKQLEALSKKGGDWSVEAKKILEHDYGYP